ncbi:hypothetical protein ACFQ22_13045 [Lentilactobacillus raoultii]|uniref:DNA-binding protein n=1 Tax=Lentilactobacillus raoultii TaxID=1987503 RepID=A0ABW3PNU4_9LACO|nr:hypothetical protein [Lentilactobacillus raoultii]
MTEPLQVKLPEEASEELRQQVFAAISVAVDQAKRKANQGEWIANKTGLAAYLGVSTDVITRMVKELGLPTHHLSVCPKITFFNRDEVNSFILNNGYIK